MRQLRTTAFKILNCAFRSVVAITQLQIDRSIDWPLAGRVIVDEFVC
jgi:hypothetical protein